MIVKVLYFAVARDLALHRSEKLSLSEGASIRDLAGKILGLHPGLKALKESIRFSMNCEVVEEGTILHAGDEVGVLPPVSGG